MQKWLDYGYPRRGVDNTPPKSCMEKYRGISAKMAHSGPKISEVPNLGIVHPSSEYLRGCITAVFITAPTKLYLLEGYGGIYLCLNGKYLKPVEDYPLLNILYSLISHFMISV